MLEVGSKLKITDSFSAMVSGKTSSKIAMILAIGKLKLAPSTNSDIKKMKLKAIVGATSHGCLGSAENKTYTLNGAGVPCHVLQ